MDSCQFKAQGPSRTCNESQEEGEEHADRVNRCQPTGNSMTYFRLKMVKQDMGTTLGSWSLLTHTLPSLVRPNSVYIATKSDGPSARFDLIVGSVGSDWEVQPWEYCNAGRMLTALN